MHHLSHRQFLASTAAAGLLGAVPSLLISGRPALAIPTTTIRAGAYVIEVSGRPATDFRLTQPDGSRGLITEAGKSFRVRLENQLNEETVIHWHGLTPPWRQDGMPNPHRRRSSKAPPTTATSHWLDDNRRISGLNEIGANDHDRVTTIFHRTSWNESRHLLRHHLLAVRHLRFRRAGQRMHELISMLIPGFTWISWESFLIGLVVAFGYGWYVALIFVPLHNFFVPREEK